MLIQDIFKKPIDRPIEGVIKADDTSHLLTEVDEYVITTELASKLMEFFEAYNQSDTNTGVWISGFFGSGKSHLLKILSLVLANQSIQGQKVGDLFLEKAGDCDDRFLPGEIETALRFDAQSILFNIDQKADVISKKEDDAILSVFVKVFNELRGYYPKQAYIAKFEHDLDKQGLFGSFKKTYLELSGKSWEDSRKNALLLGKKKFAEVYAQVTGQETEDGLDLLKQYRDTYRMSIEDFAEEVAEYINGKGANFRLNFFVDEVGQFIADNSKLMVNLQTIVETLSTKCKGRAWVIVTSQEDLSNIVGEMAKIHNATDFSKIQDRFSTRPKLTSQNVEEVIQKRLLSKKEGDAMDSLQALYDKENQNFKTLFDFSGGSRRYGTFDSQESFIQSYPFPRYQYDLFQAAINGLSQHNAFTGKHSSVGERSMLGVFQRVAKEIIDRNVGSLATFDLMFEGIRNIIKVEHQQAILTAENNLGNPLHIQVLKALFLVKHLKEFKATSRNVAVLVTDAFSVDLNAHLKTVQEALNELENQTYIQRTGEYYQFLTNDEKDIENEIKQLDTPNSQIIDCAAKIIFESILGTKKFEHTASGNAYTFSRKTDGYLLGRDQELGIHIITPMNDDYEDHPTLVAKSMATKEMLVVLPEDKRLYQDLRSLEQTEKYIKQFNTSGATSTRRLLIESKASENRTRRDELTARIGKALGVAEIIINGNTLDLRTSDAKQRLQEGFQTLVSDVYPNLGMLTGTFSIHSMDDVLQQETDDLFAQDDTTITEPENEILNLIKRRKNEGSTTSAAALLEAFSSRPYGWGDSATLTLTAKLFRRGKIELLFNATLLDVSGVRSHLGNSGKHQTILVQLQRDFPAAKVKALKELYEELFDKRVEATDPKEIADTFIRELRASVEHLKMCLDRKADFHFVDHLQPAIDSMSAWLNKDYSVFLTDIDQVDDEWLDFKEDLIAPITDFIQGSSGKLYAKIKTFYKDNLENKAAIEELPEYKTLEELVLDDAPYRGQKMKSATTSLSACQHLLEETILKKRSFAKGKIESLNERFKTLDGFAELPKSVQDLIFSPAKESIKTIESTHLLARIENTLIYAETQGYQKQLDTFNAAVEKARKEASEKDQKESESKPSTAQEGSNSGGSSPGGGQDFEETSGKSSASIKPTEPQTVAHPHVVYAAKQVLVTSIRVDSQIETITSSEDLDAYLATLKTTYQEKLDAGYHIQL